MTMSQETKACKKCGVEKLLSEYHKNKTNSDGRQLYCKTCNIELSKQYYIENKEKIKQYNIKNRQQIIEYRKQYRIKNKEQLAKKRNQYYINNREKMLKINNQYYIDNRDKMLEQNKQWRIANPEKVIAKKINRRAMELNATGKFTADDIAQLLVLQKGKCAICHCSIKNGYHVDHIVPLSKGGSNSKENLQLLCPTCNLSKGARDPVIFMQQRGFLL